jgi:hypothetical protein
VAPYHDPEGIAWSRCIGEVITYASVESMNVSPGNGSEQAADNSMLRKIYLPTIQK